MFQALNRALDTRAALDDIMSLLHIMSYCYCRISKIMCYITLLHNFV